MKLADIVSIIRVHLSLSLYEVIDLRNHSSKNSFFENDLPVLTSTYLRKRVSPDSGYIHRIFLTCLNWTDVSVLLYQLSGTSQYSFIFGASEYKIIEDVVTSGKPRQRNEANYLLCTSYFVTGITLNSPAGYMASQCANRVYFSVQNVSQILVEGSALYVLNFAPDLPLPKTILETFARVLNMTEVIVIQELCFRNVTVQFFGVRVHSRESQYVLQEEIVFLYRKSFIRITQPNISTIYDSATWISIIVVGLLSAVLLTLGTKDSFASELLDVTAMLLCQGISRRSSQIIIMIFLLMSLIISNAYRGCLLAKLNSPNIKSLNTLQDLIDFKQHEVGKIVLCNYLSPIATDLDLGTILNGTRFSALLDLDAISFCDVVFGDSNSLRWAKPDLNTFVASREVVFQKLTGLPINPAFPHTDTINRVITRLHEAFLMERDLDIHHGDHKRFRYKETVERKLQTVSLHTTSAPLCILLFGSIAACLCFLGDLVLLLRDKKLLPNTILYSSAQAQLQNKHDVF